MAQKRAAPQLHVRRRSYISTIMTILNLVGLVLNLVGTIIVSFFAGSLMTRIHTALMTHQTTLEAYLSGQRDIPLFTGLDAGRADELKRSESRLRCGLWLIVIGFILQAVATAAPLFSKS